VRDVVAPDHERRQRGIIWAKRTGRLVQAADRLDDVVAERPRDDPEESRGRVREQTGHFRATEELEVGAPLELEGGNVPAQPADRADLFRDALPLSPETMFRAKSGHESSVPPTVMSKLNHINI
jgi:hypothetical protein